MHGHIKYPIPLAAIQRPKLIAFIQILSKRNKNVKPLKTFHQVKDTHYTLLPSNNHLLYVPLLVSTTTTKTSKIKDNYCLMNYWTINSRIYFIILSRPLKGLCDYKIL